MATRRLLAGDIGGTNARLVLYDAPADALSTPADVARHRVVAHVNYKNHEFASFLDVLCAFLALPDVAARPIDAACLATAGPVTGNRINFTNREGWIIDGRVIGEEFGIPRVQLVNDFVAAGYGLLALDEGDVVTLQADAAGAGSDAGPAASGGAACGAAPKALVGAGTGLGECFLTPDGEGVYRAFASEGGHVEFAPRDAVEEELLHFLEERLGAATGGGGGGDRARVSVERVVSGRGLENIYEFLRAKFPAEVDPALDGEYDRSKERGRLIGSERFNYGLFRQAVEIMMGVYGGEVGNVALKFLPFAGLYVAGGIAPKNIDLIRAPDSKFMRRLRDKGRVAAVLATIPVHVVMREDLGLRGAHIVAARLAAAVAPSGAAVAREGAAASRGKGGVTFSADLRSAIGEYPLAYAAVASVTAAATAAALVLGGRVLSRMQSRAGGAAP